MLKPPLTWVEISKSTLEHNITQYRTIIDKQTKLAAVIKANAYGHGLVLIGKLLQENKNIDLLCTANLSEALVLRKHGITKPILAISYIDAPIEQAIAHQITMVVYDLKTAQTINQIAQSLQKKAAIHIKVDTGLCRLGSLANEAISFIQQIHNLPFLTITGIFSHFAQSDKQDLSFTQQQLKKFHNITQELSQQGIAVPFAHMSCSAAITAIPACHYNVVRLGGGLYGFWSSKNNKELTQTLYPGFELKQILTWKTKIIQIKTIPSNSQVNYGGTYKTTKKTKIAVLPIGYYEGYDYRLSNKGIVLINNHYARVIGVVCMNLTIVDISAIKNVKVGDEVILIGNHQNLTPYDIAQTCNIALKAVTTRINPEIPRIVML